MIYEEITYVRNLGEPKISYNKEVYFEDNVKYVKEDILNGNIIEDCIISINNTLCELMLYKKRFTIITPSTRIYTKLYE